MRCLLRATALLALFASCGPGESREPGPPADLPLETVTEVGGSAADGPAAFGWVGDVDLLLDPIRVVVADVAAGEVKVFSQAGSHLGTFGGRGRGPLEFSRLTSVAVGEPDQIAGFDAQQQKLVIFHDQGAESWALDFSDYGPRTPELIALRDDGMAVFALPQSPTAFAGSESRALVDTVPIVGALDGELSEITSRVSPVQTYITAGPISAIEPAVLGPRPLVASVGSSLVFSDGRDVDVGTGTGSLERLVLGVNPMPSRPELVELEREVLLDHPGASAVANGTSVRDAWADAVGQLPVSDSVAPFDRMVGGSGDRFFLRRSGVGEAGQRSWLVVSIEGSVLGQVRLPEAEDVLAVSGSYMATVRKDELGAHIVSLKRIGTAGSSGAESR